MQDSVVDQKIIILCNYATQKQCAGKCTRQSAET